MSWFNWLLLIVFTVVNTVELLIMYVPQCIAAVWGYTSPDPKALFEATAAASLLLQLFGMTDAGEFMAAEINEASGAVPLDRDAESRLRELCRPVFDRARKKGLIDRSADDIIYRMMPVRGINASAMGTRHILVTPEALRLPDRYLQAILAHEIGHICHDRHTMLMVYYAQVPVNLALAVGNLLMRVLRFVVIIPYIGLAALVLIFLIRASMYIVALINFVFGGFSQFIARSREYRADRTAWELGCGNALTDVFEQVFLPYDSELPWYAAWNSDHPAMRKRIDRIRSYGQNRENFGRS